MTDKHTPEPWIAVQGGCLDPDVIITTQQRLDESLGEICGMDVEFTGKHGDEQKANARRIVACINACAGIPTYQLSGVDNEPVNLGFMIDRLRTDAEILSERRKYWKKKFLARSSEWGRVKKQRDDLLAAIAIAEPVMDAHAGPSRLADFRAAIASVKESK